MCVEVKELIVQYIRDSRRRFSTDARASEMNISHKMYAEVARLPLEFYHPLVIVGHLPIRRSAVIKASLNKLCDQYCSCEHDLTRQPRLDLAFYG
jgi:hypothetical protein